MVEVKVPDIGDFKDVEVIEVLVKPGDTVAREQSLITVESDKASMEIPSSAAGTVSELRIQLGDKVREGSVILLLEAAAGEATGAAAPGPSPQPSPQPSAADAGRGDGAGSQQRDSGGSERAGDRNASAEAGAAEARSPSLTPAPVPVGEGRKAAGAATASPESTAFATEMIGRPAPVAAEDLAVKPHASPSVRKFARELGVELTRVRGTGPKGRITPEDVREFVKRAVAGAALPAAAVSAAGLAVLGWPQVDFARFGPVERIEMSRIKKLSGPNLHRNWVMIPHVTNHEDADVTDLEAFRVQLNDEKSSDAPKLTMLAFLIKACVVALKRFPDFNSSIDPDGSAIVRKHYWHIGFAADTPNGLVVPVVRDADRKGVFEIAAETSALAARARDGKLAPADMQGGTFSISSLGGIGGTGFTPIINAPEVAILGVCRSVIKPVWDGKAFAPRLMLPLSLSWDHRVVDGASAARFNAYLAQLLADFRRAML